MGDEGEEVNGTDKGPRDVVDVSWTTGKFFSFLIYFLFTDSFFRYESYLLAMTNQQHERGM